MLVDHFVVIAEKDRLNHQICQSSSNFANLAREVVDKIAPAFAVCVIPSKKPQRPSNFVLNLLSLPSFTATSPAPASFSLSSSILASSAFFSGTISNHTRFDSTWQLALLLLPLLHNILFHLREPLLSIGTTIWMPACAAASERFKACYIHPNSR